MLDYLLSAGLLNAALLTIAGLVLCGLLGLLACRACETGDATDA